MKEIDYIAVKDWRVPVYRPVKYPVDEISHRSAEYHSQREPQIEWLFPVFVNEIKNEECREDSKKGKEQLAADLQSECHPGILDVRYLEYVRNNIDGGTVGDTLYVYPETGYVNALYKDLSYLVCQYDCKRNK